MALRKGFLLTLFCMLLPLLVLAQDEPLFTVFSEDPIVSHGEAADWDSQYTDPGAVIYHDGLFHMFRNGFKGWPASVQIGYLTSEDGLNWTEVTPDPVMRTDEVPYAGVAALASDALVMDDGTWVLYFYTWENRSGTGSPGSIGRATASNPTGPWTPDTAPVLTPGSPGSWDDNRLTAPRVVKTDDGYRMYYSGSQKNKGVYTSIGMATSTDGITWTKYDNPDTTDALYAESDPVLTTGDSKEFIGQPMVQQTPDGWVMLYRTANGSGAGMMIGYTISQDGLKWEYKPDNRFWDTSRIPRSSDFWYTAFVFHDDTYYLYIEGGRPPHTDIYVATHEGSLAG